MTFTRVNPLGLIFKLVERGQYTEAILSDKKTILLDMPIDEVNSSWYKWQMCGELIQVAFRGLPAAQREFLITGITPNEWNEIFKEEEN